jgi:chromosome segregation ATPase
MNSPNLLKIQMERMGEFIDDNENGVKNNSASVAQRKSGFEKFNPFAERGMATVLSSLAEEWGRLEDELHASQISLSEVQRQVSELSQKLAANQKLLRSTIEERDKYYADLGQKSELCKELIGQQSSLSGQVQAFQERYEKLKTTHRNLVLRLQKRDREVAQIYKNLGRLKVRVEEKISSLNDEHQKALKKLEQQSQEKLALKKGHYEREVARLESKIEEGVRVEAKTRLEKEKLLITSQALSKKLEDFEEKERKLQRQIGASQLAIEQNRFELSRSIQQVEKFWKEEVGKREQEWLQQKSRLLEDLKSQELRFQDRDKKVIGEAKQLESKLIQAQTEKQHLERRINEMGLELERTRLQVDRKRDLAPEVIDESRALKGRLNLLETELRLRQESERTLKEELWKSQSALQSLVGTSQDYEKEIQKLSLENSRVSQDLKKEVEEKKSLTRRIIEQKDEMEKAQGELEVRQAEVGSLRVELEKSKAELEKSRIELGQNEGRVREFEQKIMETHSETENEKREIENSKMEMERALIDLEQKRKSFAEKDLRLKAYCKSLDQQKAEVRKQYLVLHGEVQNLRAMNPLREYLVVTDREVSRLQILLAKTPQFSEERGRLEDEVSRLIKQRDSLREMVTSADREMERRALRLMTLVQSEELVDCPPLPPEPKA